MEMDNEDHSLALSDDVTTARSELTDSGYSHNHSEASHRKGSHTSTGTDRRNIDDIAAPSDLKFDENERKDRIKLEVLEAGLENPNINATQWKKYAKSSAGLVSDGVRKAIWPRLMGVTDDEISDAPSLSSLADHPEYQQVVLDVNRSLKRFPPGIPYEQRVALQDQLTVLILRVIIKYPELKYYQGYHDVAITLLLVCGERASFPLLCRLSVGDSAPLAPFMQATMQPTQHRLNYIYALIKKMNPQLAFNMESSKVGTMFALPWFLTWFGHSLNQYTDVVRLYDYFLCSPPMFPVYVTAALVLHRARDLLELDVDMATYHCFLSQLPDNLPFEEILETAAKLYSKYPPENLEKDVIKMEKLEEKQRKEEEERAKRRQLARRPPGGPARPGWQMKFQQLTRAVVQDVPLLGLFPARYRAIIATATFLVGAYALYRCDYTQFNYIR